MPWQAKKRSVLVPFDFSEASKSALEAARAFVDEPSHVSVLHVVAPPLPTTPGIVWGSFDEEDLKARAYASLREALADADCADFEAHVAIGRAADEIVALARDEGSQLIVIPSHSRRGVERLLLGSVSERVVRLAPCPVLVLRDAPPAG